MPFKKMGGGRDSICWVKPHFQVPFVENDRENDGFLPFFSCSSYSPRMGWCSNQTTCWLSQWTNITVLPIGSMIPGVLGSVFRTYIKSHTIHVWYTYQHLPLKKKTKKWGKYTSPMDGMGISRFRNFRGTFLLQIRWSSPFSGSNHSRAMDQRP